MNFAVRINTKLGEEKVLKPFIVLLMMVYYFCPYILDDHDHYHSKEDQTNGKSGF